MPFHPEREELAIRVGVVRGRAITHEHLILDGHRWQAGPGDHADEKTDGPIVRARHRWGRPSLSWPAGASGRFARGPVMHALEELHGLGAKERRGRIDMPLERGDRAKIKAGGVTLLVQVVEAPARPLRRFVVPWEDLPFAAAVLLSAGLHLAAWTWMESLPEPPREVLLARAERFIPPVWLEAPPEPPEPPQLEAIGLDAPADASEREATPDEASDGSPKDAGVAAEAPAPRRTREQLVAEVGDMGILKVVGTTGAGVDSPFQAFLNGTETDPNVTASLGRTPMRRREEGWVRGGSADGDDLATIAVDTFGGGDGGRVQKRRAATLTATAEPDVDLEGAPKRAVGAEIRKQLPRIKRCYDKVLTNDDPDLQGKLTLSWIIRADGSVGAARMLTNSTGHQGLEACVLQALGRMRFTPPGEEVEVASWPIVLAVQ